MNDATVAAKPPTVVETVTMQDGRVVEFTGKQRLKKDSFIGADGTVTVRLDFRNGHVISYSPKPDMVSKFVAHGIEAKLGDETNGEPDLDDAVLAVEELIDSLNAGKWSAKRAGDGMAGTSVLLRAIVKVTGKPVAAIKAFLAGKSQKVKMALRERPEFAPAVAEIEAAKAKTAKGVDVTADLAELTNLPA